MRHETKHEAITPFSFNMEESGCFEKLAVSDGAVDTLFLAGAHIYVKVEGIVAIRASRAGVKVVGGG